jgi:4-diphosphocytidyl-2-C-methyl-D-erythritol kinase
VTAPLFSLLAPAKINPVLEVLAKRPDGYHELALVFQAVGLTDEISFAEGKEGIRLLVEESSEPLAEDGSNLIVKAGNLFIKEILRGKGGAEIRLKKKIPLAAGLGGGSSDAAAALLGLDRLFGTKLTFDQFQSLAEVLGSDVPFFLTGGTALGTGRGEKIEPWPSELSLDLVLVKPLKGLSTPAVYQSGRAVLTDGSKARGFRELLAGSNPGKIASALFNGLEPAAVFLMEEIGAIRKALLDAGCLGALVSGSGPTVFGMASSPAEAGRIRKKLEGKGWSVFVTKTVSDGIRSV